MNAPPPGDREPLGARHLLDQQPTVRLEQGVQPGREQGVVRGSDVLAHLDRGDRVERRVGHVAVVLQPHVDELREPFVPGPLLHKGALLAGEGHRGYPHAVLPGGVDGQRPPATPDVEQSLSLAQAELAADQVELRRLRLLQRPGGRGPVRAGVGHRGVEDEPVEVVGQVVVVGDRGPVAFSTVDGAGELRLHQRRLRPRPHHAEPQRQPDRLQPLTRAQRGSLIPRADAAPDPAEPVGQVALHVDLAGDERLGQAEFVGPPQQSSQRATVAQHEHRSVGRAGLGTVPRPYPYRQLSQQSDGQTG